MILLRSLFQHLITFAIRRFALGGQVQIQIQQPKY